MISISAILLGIIIFCWVSFIWSRRKYYYAHKKLGGPWGLPILGSGLHFLDRSKLLDWIGETHKKYGYTWSSFLGLKPVVVTSDPEIIEEVFKNELLVDKMDIYNVLNDFLKEGLFSSKYDKWSHARKHINKAFTNKIFLDFYPIFNKQGREFCDVIEKYAGKDAVDIYDYIHKLQLDTACITTMGQETNFLKGANAELLHAYTDVLNITSDRLFNPIIANSFVFKYLYPKKNQFDKRLKVMQSNTLKFVEKKISDIQNGQKLNAQDNSTEDDMNITKSKSIFIDIMVREFLTGNFTWEEMQNEVNTMILAAYETTTNVLFMTIVLLAMNPQYQEKLYDEIISITSEDDVNITPEHVQQMVYVEMIMNETMRLISPVPLVGRNASKDITLKNKMFIAKDTNIVIDILHLHRRKDIWGPDADHIFNPDNFLKENLVDKHPYSFIPFTKGIRNCIGWRYAMISYKIMLSQILKRYKISTTFKFEDLVYIESIVIKFKENPKIKLELRKTNN